VRLWCRSRQHSGRVGCTAWPSGLCGDRRRPGLCDPVEQLGHRSGLTLQPGNRKQEGRLSYGQSHPSGRWITVDNSLPDVPATCRESRRPHKGPASVHDCPKGRVELRGFGARAGDSQLLPRMRPGSCSLMGRSAYRPGESFRLSRAGGQVAMSRVEVNQPTAPGR
jgi:hypothetical protein